MAQTDDMQQANVMDAGGNERGGSVTVEAGPIKFHLQHRDLLNDQGVGIRVLGPIEGKETEILRFDCFDQTPHYHYAPSGINERHNLDKTTAGNPVGWTIGQLRTNFAAMLNKAGAEDLASQAGTSEMQDKLDEVESTAREMAISQRSTVTHNRGTEVFETGNIRFGLEYRQLSVGSGLAIHVLGDVAGQEVELLAFDCFDKGPHYHYGPRNKNIRLYWDQTAVPDTLRWTLDQFKQRKLPDMLNRAGYPGIVAELDMGLIDATLPQIESKALSMVEQNA